MLLLAISLSYAHPDLEVQGEQLDRLLEQVEDPELLLRRAELRSRLGRFDEALDDLHAAEHLGLDVRLVRALVLVDALDPGALEALDEAIAATPHWRAFQARALLRAERGDLREALLDYDAALALHPDPDLALERGAVAGRLDPELAADGYLEAMRALGPAVSVELAAAEALRVAHRPEEARQVLDALITRSDPQPRWLLLRAQVSSPPEAQADRALALELAQQRYEARPNPLNRETLEAARAAVHDSTPGRALLPLGGLLLLGLGRRRC